MELALAFRVSKNGGTGIGANYNDGQIPANGLRVAGNVQLGKTSIGGSPDLAPGNGLNVQGSVLAKSNMKVYGNLAIGSANFSGSTALQINSGTGESPLWIKINNATKMRISNNGGTSLGGNAAPETNGLVVQGNILARSNLNVDGKMQVTGDSNVAVSILTLDGGSPLKANVNNAVLLVTHSVPNYIGQCTITFPFNITNSFIQTDVDPTSNRSLEKPYVVKKLVPQHS